MNPEQLVAVLDQMYSSLTQGNMVGGDILHTIYQLRDALDYHVKGMSATINAPIEHTFELVTGTSRKVLDTFTRYADVLVERAGQLPLIVEIKTGDAANALRKGERQLLSDLMSGMKGQAESLWKLLDAPIQQNRSLIEESVKSSLMFMKQMGASEAALKRAAESIRFEDAFGDAIKFTWSENGPISIMALKAASHSPDFGPAMQIVFGPSGKMADAAHDAAAGVNLDPVEQAFEKKLASGLGSAIDGAGKDIATHAQQTLSQRASSGASAIGTAMTSISAMHESVTKLDEAWHKPMKSTKDYMDLIAAAGGAVSQAGQLIDAFSAVSQTFSLTTRIATIAQAAFNAVMAMNPVVLVVIAVVALIAAIVLLIVYWDQVKAALRDNPWLAVAAVLFGVIAIIVLVIAYWEEIKLATLSAANFISIQLQRVGQFFIGIGIVAAQVWAWIAGTSANAGIAVINTFIAAGVAIQNFFVKLINSIIEMYNKLADTAVGKAAGMTKVAQLPQVDVQAKLLPPKEVPQVNVAAAFAELPGAQHGFDRFVSPRFMAVCDAIEDFAHVAFRR